MLLNTEFLLNIHLFAVDDVQASLQGIEALALEVVDLIFYFFIII